MLHGFQGVKHSYFLHNHLPYQLEPLYPLTHMEPLQPHLKDSRSLQLYEYQSSHRALKIVMQMLDESVQQHIHLSLNISLGASHFRYLAYNL